MQLSGKLLIGQNAISGKAEFFQAVNPATNKKIEPVYTGASREEVEQACVLAEAAFDSYRETSLETRADFLETIGSEIKAISDQLIERCTTETGLPAQRVEGELGRTCNQLSLFAQVVRSGEWLDVRIDPAMPDRKPMPRGDLRQRHIPMGPVAVFGASNFPLAFSVAGGDTASALAAGCPVVVKGHPAHPGTSELVGLAIQRAVKQCNLHEGVFSLLFGAGNEVGQTLVADPRIKAVGFTGSRGGGLAIQKIAQSRPEPVPVYAEMSSINPVFLMPGALKVRGRQIAEGFVGSLNMGAGQFCTNPGLLVAIKGPELDQFLQTTQSLLETADSQTMLTPGIYDAYEKSSARLGANINIKLVGRGQVADGPNQCQAGLYATTASEFLNDTGLQEEVFGATSLVVECADFDDMRKVVAQLEGQLTATIHIEEVDHGIADAMLPLLELKAGRILANGWPTGVEVCHAMVHGGPYPATSDSRTTSVGSAAIFRFLRPVCYQSLPTALLPKPLLDDDPLGVSRLVDGQRVN